jgi:signal transduction histidine kinase
MHILETHPPMADKRRIFRELELATESVPETGIAHAHHILHLLAEEGVDDKALTMQFNSSIGMCHLLLGRYDSARVYLKKALPLAKEMNDAYNITRITNNIANSYSLEGAYVEALEHYLEGLQQCDQLRSESDSANYSRLSANIAETYYMMGNEDQALRYATRAIETRTEGHLYAQGCWIISAISLNRGELDKAETYALESWRATEPRNFIARCFTAEVLARIHVRRGNHANALEYARTSLRYAEQLGDPNSFVKAYNALAIVYLTMKQYAQAEQAALQAQKMHPHAFEIEPALPYSLAVANLWQGNPEKAEAYLQAYSEITRSNNSNNFQNALASMEIQYEIRGKELRIAALESQKRLYIGIGLALVVILALTTGLFSFLHRLHRQKNKINQQHIKQLEQERQIDIAQSIIRTERDIEREIAGELHDSLGSLLTLAKLSLPDTDGCRQVDEMLDHSISELRRITHRLMPLSLREGLRTALEDFCLKTPNAAFHFYGKEERLGEPLELFLWRCTHELVNNALKHAAAAKINVQLVQDDGSLSLTVQDDGCGFDPQAPAKGIGLRNLRSRINAYHGALCILSSPGAGTEVNIRIQTQKI